MMSDIDDFFVINDINYIDLNKAIEKYKYFKNSSIPDNYLIKHFGALLQDNYNKMMFKKKEITNSPLQEFWTLRFLDIAENNYDNVQINKYSSFEKKDLKEIVNIINSSNKIAQVKNFLLAKGIYLYFIDFLPGTNIDGAV
jgi:hypothetical protein